MIHRRSILKDKSGTGNELYTIIFFLFFFILILFIFEYVRALIIAQGVRDAAQAAIITAATENWDSTYKGRRDGYSGAWHKSRGADETTAFIEMIYKEDIAIIMNRIIGASDIGSFNQKWGTNGKVEFRYRITNIVWEHQELKPRDPLSKHFKATATIDLKIPWGFNFNDQGGAIDMEIIVKAIYMPKF